MASKYYFFSGVAKWAKLDKPDQKYGFYGIDVYLDEGSMQKFDESGLNLKMKTDEGGSYVTFRRDPEKLLDGMAEKPEKLIFDKEVSKYVSFDKAIGNDSLVTVKVQVYDSQKGKGHRLEAVAVENLVPYENGDDDLPF